MNVVMITTNDPAGMGIAFKNAINRYTEHKCRLVTTEIRYNFLFEKDLHVPWVTPDGFGEIETLLKDADILHFHLLADANLELGPIKVKDHVKGKAIVHHHHGHPHFRANPHIYREKYRNNKGKVLVSTPDLLHLVPEAVWQPNLIPIHDPLLRPSHAAQNGTVRIGQAPTRKDLKNTQELIDVATELKRTFVRPQLELDIIENCLHKECLKRKNQCQIVFDHMQGYYGVSSLESLSQGKPVIAGLDDWNIQHIKRFTGCEELPWRIARNSEELEGTLKDLIMDEKAINEIGLKSRHFMEKHWNEEFVLNRLLKFYEEL